MILHLLVGVTGNGNLNYMLKRGVTGLLALVRMQREGIPANRINQTYHLHIDVSKLRCDLRTYPSP